MRFAAARARLLALPVELPPAPELLTPARSDHVEWPEPLFTRSSAVLVLLFPGPDDEATVVLTERPAGDLRHAGEISLPGGVAEEGDVDPVATALREAREEIGLDPEAAGLEAVGSLGPVWIPVSGFRVTPVIALAARRPALVADPREVAAILEVPVAAFLPGAPVELVETTIREIPLRYGAFPLPGRRVWGATARVLGQLGAVLAREPETWAAYAAAAAPGPPGDLRVRLLGPADGPAVESVAASLAPWFDPTDVTRMREDVEGGVAGLLLEDATGAALGFVIWGDWDRPLDPEKRGFAGWEAPPRTAEIVWLAVARPWRGRGLGKRLLAEAEAAARAAGHRWLVLWTVADSAARPAHAETRAFYRRAGYADLVVDRRYRTRSGADRLLFGREL